MSRPRTLALPPLLVLALSLAAVPSWSAATRTSPAPAKHRTHARHRGAPGTPPAAAPPATAPVVAPGMIVGIDPESGALGMPSRDDLLQLSAAERTGLARTSAGLVPVRLSDGTLMIPLQGRFMDYAVVRRDAAGLLRAGCVDDSLALARWFDRGVPVPAPVREDR